MSVRQKNQESYNGSPDVVQSSAITTSSSNDMDYFLSSPSNSFGTNEASRRSLGMSDEFLYGFNDSESSLSANGNAEQYFPDLLLIGQQASFSTDSPESSTPRSAQHPSRSVAAYSNIYDNSLMTAGTQHLSSPRRFSSSSGSQEKQDEQRCWEHGCEGRMFSTRSNLVRHQKEKSKAHSEHQCPGCGAIFSRATALRQHVVNQSCARIRRYSNGRERPMPKLRQTGGGPDG